MKQFKNSRKLSVFLLIFVMMSANISILTFAWFTSEELRYSERNGEPPNPFVDFQLKSSFRPVVEVDGNNIKLLDPEDPLTTVCGVYIRFIFPDDTAYVKCTTTRTVEVVQLYELEVGDDTYFVYPYVLEAGDILTIVDPDEPLSEDNFETISAIDYILASEWGIEIYSDGTVNKWENDTREIYIERPELPLDAGSDGDNGLEAPGNEDEPVVDEPIEDEPVEDEPVEDEPIEDEPIEDEPIEDEPVEDEPTEYEPIDNETNSEEPIGEEPVGEEFAAS